MIQKLYRPVPNAEGKIKTILLSYGKKGFSQITKEVIQLIFNYYLSIISVFPSDVRFIIILDVEDQVKNGTRFFDFSNIFDGFENVELIQRDINYTKLLNIKGANGTVPFPLTKFIQDALHVFYKKNQKIHMIRCLPRNEDMFQANQCVFVADELMLHGKEKDDKMSMQISKIHMDGGNILTYRKGDKDIAIAGSDILDEIISKFPGASPAKAAEELKNIYGVDNVLWIDNNIVKTQSVNCLFHIDLFITPAGKIDGKELILLAKIDDKDIHILSTQGSNNNSYLEDVRLIQKGLDRLEKSFHKSKYCVVRLPLLIIAEGIMSVPTFYTYNNCLVEEYGGERIIYLPSYKDIVDNKPHPMMNSVQNFAAFMNTEVFKRYETSNGIIDQFENELQNGILKKYFKNKINLIRSGFWQDIQHKGSLHCLTKVLERKYD